MNEALHTSASDLALRSARTAPDTRLTDGELKAMAALVEGWTVHADVMERSFSFPDYHGTMAFVNAVAWIAHRGDHHPDLQVGYNRCTVQWSTHSAGGLTLKDLICAAQVDALQCPPA